MLGNNALKLLQHALGAVRRALQRTQYSATLSLLPLAKYTQAQKARIDACVKVAGADALSRLVDAVRSVDALVRVVTTVSQQYV